MSVAAEVEQFIREIAPDAGGLEPGADLLAAGLIDSLAIVQLIEFLEERYGVAVGDDDLAPENFKSVESIVRFVTAKGGGR